jgi:alanyl-tRNA synthetase
MLENKKKYHPQMHTCEHILNKTMINMFGVQRSFNNHIERKKSKLDFHFDRDLTQDEILLVNQKVNEVLRQNLEVTSEIFDKKDCEGMLTKDKLNSIADEQVRIIKVGNYDTCPCSGIHVDNTSEIGEFRISTTGFNNGVLRIRFKIAPLKD